MRDQIAKLRERKAAERRRAADLGQPYAEPLDLGVSIDVGAPLPHVVTSGSRTAVVFHRGIVDPDWDGTYVTVVDPSSDASRQLAVIVFDGVMATLMGPPNDEAISGHPLWNSGLQPYAAHVVVGSEWIDEYERRNRVHPHHSPEHWQRLTHYLIAFHDETFECIAESHRVASVDAGFRATLHDTIDDVLGG